jgi:hypothetical protein
MTVNPWGAAVTFTLLILIILFLNYVLYTVRKGHEEAKDNLRTLIEEKNHELLSMESFIHTMKRLDAQKDARLQNLGQFNVTLRDMNRIYAAKVAELEAVELKAAEPVVVGVSPPVDVKIRPSTGQQRRRSTNQ